MVMAKVKHIGLVMVKHTGWFTVMAKVKHTE